MKLEQVAFIPPAKDQWVFCDELYKRFFELTEDEVMHHVILDQI